MPAKILRAIEFNKILATLNILVRVANCFAVKLDPTVACELLSSPALLSILRGISSICSLRSKGVGVDSI